jgi:hypothetical protein
MFFGILFNAFSAMGEISQMYSQRPIIVSLLPTILIIAKTQITGTLSPGCRCYGVFYSRNSSQAAFDNHL